MSAWMREFSNLATAYYNARRARGDFASSGGDDPLSYKKKQLDVEGKFLENLQKKRELQDVSPRMKYMEKERSEQVTSALGTFAEQWKGASAASKDLLEEQMRGLHGMMTKSEVAQSEMIIKRTPLNPRVQRGLWFDETNPEPGMPVLRDGDKIYTPPKTEEYWAVWGEYGIKHSEWKELREMVVAGKEGGKKEEGRFKTVPRHYQTLKPKVTMYRSPLTGELKAFDWGIGDDSDILNAVEKGWSTFEQMMTDGMIPLGAPKQSTLNGATVAVQPKKNAATQQTELSYTPTSPLDESKVMPSEGLMQAVDAIASGMDLKSANYREKDPTTRKYWGELREIKKLPLDEKLLSLRRMQERLLKEAGPLEKKFIPFWAVEEDLGAWQEWGEKWIPWFYTPSIGKGGFVLRPANRVVTFTGMEEGAKPIQLWWSDLLKVAYDDNGNPIKATQGKEPFTKLLDFSFDKGE